MLRISIYIVKFTIVNCIIYSKYTIYSKIININIIKLNIYHSSIMLIYIYIYITIV